MNHFGGPFINRIPVRRLTEKEMMRAHEEKIRQGYKCTFGPVNLKDQGELYAQNGWIGMYEKH